MARFQIFGLVSSMLKAVSEIRSVMDEDFFNQIDPINRLLSAKSIVELQSQVSQIFNQVNDYFDRRQNGLLIDKADEIVEYVKANCFRSSLSISELTDVFQMSRSHVSRIFNKKAGMGLVDYIHKMRVEKAKELLRDSSRSIKDISEEVGFNHITTMIRAFRNIEGVSPGIYRNIDQQ